MKRITTTVEPNGYFNEATRRALDETIEVLRDELGLEDGIRCYHPNGMPCTDCYNTGWLEPPGAGLEG